jgi:endonuclease/exonuclease/phosphatase family metal-dependent hydrolase
MMNWLIILLMVIAVVGCDDTDPLAPDPQGADLHFRGGHDRGAGTLRVMTRNVYVGANLDVVLAAEDRAQVPVLVADAYRQLLASNFVERAEALAREIRRTRPHLIGLQEISTVRIQSPGDAIVGGTIPAENVVFDYLEILLAALNRPRERYRVVAKVQNPDVEVPMLTSADPTFDDIRLTDYDVILARRGVVVFDVVEQNYAAALPVPQLGVTIPRGYTIVTAEVGRKRYRFANTHLEPISAPGVLQIQLGQAQELIAALAGGENPVVLVGDLNSEAPDGATYQLLLDNGFEDAWSSRPRRGSGLTCCHDPDLRHADVNFDQRIDYILGRPVVGSRLRAARVRIIGDHPFERTASGLWPSDHAGVWASLWFASRGRALPFSR